MEVGVFQCLLKTCINYCGRYIPFFLPGMVQSFNPFCHCSLLSLIFVMDPIFSFFFLGFGSTKEGQCAEGGVTVAGDIGVGKNREGSSRNQRWKVCMGSWGKPYHIPHVLCPTATHKMLPHPNCHHFQSTPQEPEETAPNTSDPVAREVALAPEVP